VNRTYRTITTGARLLVGAFFRRVEVSGLEHLPKEGGGILVSWHPNGLIDPGLIFSFFPRAVVFGARDGLFRWPGLGWMMRAIGTVPIYRAMDGGSSTPESRRAANAKSLDALANAVVDGQWSCLFPEGDSHDSPHLLELKTGAARFYYRARELAGPDAPPPVIIPVGLHYDSKRAFRSHALVTFHPPMPMPPEVLAEIQANAPTDGKERNRLLTREIEHVLREVVHATESWDLHYLMHRLRKLVRAERAKRAGSKLRRPRMLERTLGFARVWTGYRDRMETHPEQVTALKARIGEYDEDLRALGIDDHELDRPPRIVSPLLAFILVLQFVFVFLLLPPLLLVGYLVNLPPAGIALGASRIFAKRKKDEATIKLLLGALLLPSAWIAAGFGAALLHTQVHSVFPAIPNTPILAGIVVSLLSVLGGLISLRYLRLARETIRAVKVRLTMSRRRSSITHLQAERSALFDAVEALTAEMDLPGRVTPDGRVVEESHPDAMLEGGVARD
jgi:glycerol-3-phosphate O-acyltransferase / dihydroxyacetone phosphate acyltransferase